MRGRVENEVKYIIHLCGGVSSHRQFRFERVARYVYSLAPLTRSAVLRFTTLTSLARSIPGLAHSLRSHPHVTVEILQYVFTL